MKLKSLVEHITLVTVVVIVIVYLGFSQVNQATVNTVTESFSYTQSDLNLTTEELILKTLKSTTGSRPTYSTIRIGQTFTLNYIIHLTKVKLELFRFGNPQGDFIVRLESTSNGLPTDTTLVNDTINSADISENWQFYNFSLPYNCSATMYAVVLDYPNGSGGTDMIYSANGGDDYSDGTTVTHTKNYGTEWEKQLNEDLYLVIYGKKFTYAFTLQKSPDEIKSIKINGKAWTDYTVNKNNITCTLPDYSGTIEVTYTVTGDVPAYFFPLYGLLLGLVACFIGLDVLYLTNKLRKEGIQP